MPDQPLIRVPVRKPIHFGFVILGLILIAIFINQLSRLILQPDTVGKVSLLIWFAIFPALLWGAFRQRKKRHFYITESQAGFDSPGKDDCPCDLDRIRDYHVGPDHITITHDSISVPLGIELHRQHFTIKDWETVRLTLSERIHSLSPNATNHGISKDGSRLPPNQDLRFPCRRSPRLPDFLMGIVWVTIAISQVTLSFKPDHTWWLLALILWPYIAWHQIKLIRKRLRADLIIGLKVIQFDSNQSVADKAPHSMIRSVEMSPYFIKIRHDEGMLPFKKTLLLSHTFFTPQDWEQIQELIIARLGKSGITINRLSP